MKTRPGESRESFCSRFLILLILSVLSPASVVFAQTTTFTYQGRFTDGGTAANGTYDMQFKLFDSSVGTGNQIGSTIANGAVVVANGVFTVPLDFGSAGFSGADRFLEIGVRLARDGNAYTLLSPRQQLTSAVYAIRAGSATMADSATTATQLGGVAASQYVQTNDSRLTDARTPSAGSSDYIQNSLNAQAANFNISGNGKADTLTASNGYFMGSLPMLIYKTGNNISPSVLKLGPGAEKVGVGGDLSAVGAVSASQYNIGLGRVLSVADGGTSTSVGINSGTSGVANSFFGNNAGRHDTSSDNSFFGSNAGESNTKGIANSFFGYESGALNTTGDLNSFYGWQAGFKNADSGNSFFGAGAGREHASGVDNSFFGTSAGLTDVAGSSNTLIGYRADVGSGNLTNATAIGAKSQVAQSNSIVLGSINGVNGGTADTNVGIGTTAPSEKLTVKTATSGYGVVHTDGTITVGTYVGGSSGGGWFGTKSNHSLSFFVNDGSPSMTIEIGGTVKINTLGAAGSTSLCRNALNQISTCSSSLRYKTNIQPFIGGLSVLNRLRPITFDWKQGGMHDLGFGAEDVAAIEPLLVTRNEKGEVEGVKYDRISAVLVNAVQDQQRQISQQQEQIKLQRDEIELLKKLVCRRLRRAPVCK